jgi:hypothetical protein
MGAKISLNDKQIKGLNMLINAIKKKYKFIKGWELIHDHENYESVLFINLIMDFQEFADEYHYYLERLKYTKIDTTSLSPYMKKDNKEDTYEEIKKIRDEIEQNMTTLYQSLPEEYISHYKMTSSIDILNGKQFPRNIMIAKYIDTYQPQ